LKSDDFIETGRAVKIQGLSLAEKWVLFFISIVPFVPLTIVISLPANL